MVSSITLHPTSGRTKILLTLTLSADEIQAIEERALARHVDSTLPVPCQFYQDPNPAVRTIKGIPEFEGTQHKAFFLPKARTVMLNRPIPGKSHLRLTLPGTTDLGYINASDVERFRKWWDSTKEQIKDSLKERLFGVKAQKEETPIEVFNPVKLEETHQLNPIDPDEVAGIRKRGFDDDDF